MQDSPHAFNRAYFLKQLEESSQWDVLIIGGGATGLGSALDAASRGFKTLLLEQSDFAKGTSSRSTKLVHGGVRYLAQGDVGLVIEALKERGLLLQNAPHLVKKQAFIIPVYSLFAKMKYLIGLKLYDWLSGKRSFGRSRVLSKAAVLDEIPNLKSQGLKGGVEYYDGQFDDARLAIDLAKTSAREGAVVLNYMKVTGLSKSDSGKLKGVSAVDMQTGRSYSINARTIINATGVFADEILQLDHPGRKPMIRPSQGIHLVLDMEFLRGNKALMIPKTSDGRVLFGVPWQGHLLLGTTDTPLDEHSLEPIALEEEINFILNTASQYLSRPPERKDVLSVYAGLRPLAAPDKDVDSTKEISRSHKIYVEESGLVTITGGKWTTYRKMAEDTIDKTIQVGNLNFSPCRTASLPIDQGHAGAVSRGDQGVINAAFGISAESIRYAVENEMACTLEDVLARRFRVLFLDAEAAIVMAAPVAGVMADLLGYDEAWQQEQINQFTKLASAYLIQPHGKIHSNI